MTALNSPLSFCCNSRFVYSIQITFENVFFSNASVWQSNTEESVLCYIKKRHNYSKLSSVVFFADTSVRPWFLATFELILLFHTYRIYFVFIKLFFLQELKFYKKIFVYLWMFSQDGLFSLCDLLSMKLIFSLQKEPYWY